MVSRLHSLAVIILEQRTRLDSDAGRREDDKRIESWWTDSPTQNSFSLAILASVPIERLKGDSETVRGAGLLH